MDEMEEIPVPPLSPVIVLVILSLMFSFLGVSISIASHFQMIRVLRGTRMIIWPRAAVKKSGKKRRG